MTRVTRYVISTCVAAVATTVAAGLARPTITEAYVQATLCLAVLGFAAHMLMHELPRGGRGTIAFLPFLSAVLLAPSPLVVLAVATAVWLGEWRTNRELLKRVFNVAQMSFAVAAAMLTYTAIGGQPLLQTSPSGFVATLLRVAIPATCMVVIFFAVNSLMVSGVIAIASGRRLPEVWKSNTLGSLIYDALSAPVICLLAWMYLKFGATGALFLAVPLFGVRQLYRGRRQLEQVNHDLLQLMVKAIEARDPYTSGHSVRVAQNSRIIARAIGLGSKQVERIGTAALLHDVGKIHDAFAPILRKPGKLTAEEWAIMKTHPIHSADLVSTVSHLRGLIPAIRGHHENWDGSGYPDQLAGEEIPLESRVITFADTIDAMTTDRPYRKALGEAEVRAELIRMRGKQFDPEMCDKLLLSPLFSSLFHSNSVSSTASVNVVRAARKRLLSVAG
jgi:hypothetical protein